MSTISALIIINPRWFENVIHLAGCLPTLTWCDQIIIIASEITPELKKLAGKFKARLVTQRGKNFAEWRQHAIREATTDWVLFVDTDERVTPGLEKEIKRTISSAETLSGYAIPRINRILGRDMYYGGWWPDYVLRLIKVSDFKGYHGALHEQPVLTGSTGHLKEPFHHLKHEDIESMLDKTVTWSDTEAELLFQSHHPRMNVRRFVRPFVSEIFTRLATKQGYRDGTEGLIDAVYQGYSRLITYMKLWERQLL